MPPASATGSGLTAGEAFAACIGEAAEHAALFARPPHPSGVIPGAFDAPDAALAEALAAHGPTESPFLPARRLSDGATVAVPADAVLRPAAAERPFSAGFGCAAGPTADLACRSALLEAVERHAVRLWWEEGRPARPVALERLVGTGAASLLATLRGEVSNRVSVLLDLASVPGLPVAAAVSFDPDGRGFAAGAACRPDAGAALRSALIEMAQMEIARDVVALKRARLGAAALSPADRQVEARSAIPADRAGVVDGFLGPLSLAPRPGTRTPRPCFGRPDTRPTRSTSPCPRSASPSWRSSFRAFEPIPRRIPPRQREDWSVYSRVPLRNSAGGSSMTVGTGPVAPGEIAHPALALTTFGAPSLSFAGGQLRITNRKALALLAYLANTTQGSESRQRFGRPALERIQ